MAGRRDDDRDRVLGAVSAGAAALFAATVAFVVVTQTLGPALGLEVGRPSETVLLTMIAAATTAGSLELFRRRRADD